MHISSTATITRVRNNKFWFLSLYLKSLTSSRSYLLKFLLNVVYSRNFRPMHCIWTIMSWCLSNTERKNISNVFVSEMALSGLLLNIKALLVCLLSIKHLSIDRLFTLILTLRHCSIVYSILNDETLLVCLLSFEKCSFASLFTLNVGATAVFITPLTYWCSSDCNILYFCYPVAMHGP